MSEVTRSDGILDVKAVKDSLDVDPRKISGRSVDTQEKGHDCLRSHM